jgi:hypothetical protein
MHRCTLSSFRKIALILIAAIIVLPVAVQADEEKPELGPLSREELKARIKLFAPVEIAYDESVLSEPEKAALNKLIQAARVLDEIFLQQVWSGNPDIKNTRNTSKTSGISIKSTSARGTASTHTRFSSAPPRNPKAPATTRTT